MFVGICDGTWQCLLDLMGLDVVSGLGFGFWLGLMGLGIARDEHGDDCRWMVMLSDCVLSSFDASYRCEDLNIVCFFLIGVGCCNWWFDTLDCVVAVGIWIWGELIILLDHMVLVAGALLEYSFSFFWRAWLIASWYCIRQMHILGSEVVGMWFGEGLTMSVVGIGGGCRTCRETLCAYVWMFMGCGAGGRLLLMSVIQVLLCLMSMVGVGGLAHLTIFSLLLAWDLMGVAESCIEFGKNMAWWCW